MDTKPKLSVVEIWNMTFGFLGIQIGFDLQNGNVSRIFQTLGAEIDALPILWIAAPLTGLLVQPVVGYLSDRTWNRFGRRRPYFLVGAVLASAALFLMPNAPALWVAAGTLWIMDAALNVTMEPTRALVGDMLRDEQRTTGYAMQSFFIGAGAVLAGILPWALTELGVPNTAAPHAIPQTVHIAFYVGGATLLLAVLWTIVTTREYDPERLATYVSGRPEEARATAGVRSARAFMGGGSVWLLAGLALGALIFAARLEPRPEALAFLGGSVLGQDLYVLAGLIAGFGLVQIAAGLLRRAGEDRNGFMDVVSDLYDMPATMRQLAVVQFFTWFGLFAMWIYGAPALAAHHYGATEAASAAYQEAGNWWGVLGAIRNGVAALGALVIIWLATRLDRRRMHAACLLLGAAGFAGMMLIREPGALWAPMIGVGIAWAAIVSIPYAILAGSAPPGKMGLYMGIFNIFIVVPQLLAATLLGFLLRTFFGNEPVWAFAIACASFVLAAAAVMFVREAPAGAEAPAVSTGE